MLKTGESLESMHAWSWTDEDTGLTHLTKGPYPFHSGYREVVCKGWMTDLVHAPHGATVTCLACIMEVMEW